MNAKDFSTLSISQACWLRFKKFELKEIKLDNKSGKKVFVFADMDKCESALFDFYNSEYSTFANMFMDTLGLIKIQTKKAV